MFKVGDKVKCINGSHWYKDTLVAGRVYTILEVFPDKDTCRLVDGEGFTWGVGRFILATSGDPVPVTKTEVASKLLQKAQEKLVKSNVFTTKKLDQPIVRCRCCGTKAPVKESIRPYTGNLLGFPTDTEDLTGWMLVFFPYTDPAFQPEGVYVNPMKEANKICPKCAVKVMGTLVYLVTPGASR